MRLYFNEMKMDPKPVRLYYVANCFRYDRPQAGRFREFWQMGCESIGEAGPVALAELVAMAARLVNTAGVRDYILRVGHLEVLRSALQQNGISGADQGPLMRLIDKRDDAAIRDALPQAADALLQLLDADSPQAVRGLVEAPAARKAIDHVEEVLTHVAALGVDPSRLRFDPGIARGLDYYTGFVFELDAPKLGAEKQLLGGGAYDLADVFGEPPVETAGFALGFDRLLVAMRAEGLPPAAPLRVDVHAAALVEDAVATVLSAAAAFRDAGAVVEVESRPKPPGKVLKRSGQIRARYALLVGERELEDGTVAWKDLDRGDQVTVPRAEAVDRWRSAVHAEAAETPARPRQG
jgi:histidyl-tRNA synthetase